MGRDRAEGFDASDGGRVKPSAVYFSKEFRVPDEQPVPMSLEDMVSAVERRGFVDARSGAARFLLGRVSYQHLCHYLDVVEQGGSGLRRNVRTANAVFELDRTFQAIVLEFIGLFELQFRCAYSMAMSRRYGAFAHRNPRLFKDSGRYERFLNDYSSLLGRVANGPDSTQKRHMREYGDMPIWEAVEELSMGTLSKLYKNTRNAKVKEEVAESFEVGGETLESWMSCLTVTRNECAHFGHLLGTRLARMPKRMPEIEADNGSPFFVVLMLMRLLRTNMYFGDFSLMYSVVLAGKMVRLLSSCGDEVVSCCGIPRNWKELLESADVSGLKMGFFSKGEEVPDDETEIETRLSMKMH